MKYSGFEVFPLFNGIDLSPSALGVSYPKTKAPLSSSFHPSEVQPL